MMDAGKIKTGQARSSAHLLWSEFGDQSAATEILDSIILTYNLTAEAI